MGRHHAAGIGPVIHQIRILADPCERRGTVHASAVRPFDADEFKGNSPREWEPIRRGTCAAALIPAQTPRSSTSTSRGSSRSNIGCQPGLDVFDDQIGHGLK